MHVFRPFQRYRVAQSIGFLVLGLFCIKSSTLTSRYQLYLMMTWKGHYYCWDLPSGWKPFQNHAEEPPTASEIHALGFQLTEYIMLWRMMIASRCLDVEPPTDGDAD